MAYRYIGNYDDANDIAQNAFIKAYKSLPSFRGEASFATWLYRITANVCYDEIRKQNRHNNLPLNEARPSHLATTELSPEEHVELEELKGLVKRCLNSFSSDYRLILILREIYGLSYTELAFCLDCPMNTVKARLHRPGRL